MPSSGHPVEADAPLASWTNFLRAFLALILGVMLFILAASTQSSAGEGSISQMQKIFVTRISVLSDHVTSINLTSMDLDQKQADQGQLDTPKKKQDEAKSKDKANANEKKRTTGKGKGNGKGKVGQKVVKQAKGWEPKQLRFSVSESPYEVYLHYTIVRPIAKCYKVQPRFGVNYQQKDGNATECQYAASQQVGCFIAQSKKSSYFFFIAKLTGLEPGKTYVYRIGTVTGNEKTSLDLTAAKGDSEFTWRRGVVGGTYLVFADTGTDGIKKVLDAADGETVNLVVHAGDASYASNTGECFAARYLFKPECGFNCTGSSCIGRDRQADRNLNVWNNFFETVKRFTDVVPWMTTMGNHDNDLTWFYKFRPPVKASFPGVKRRQLAPGLWSELEKNNWVGDDPFVLQANANHVMQHPYFYSFDDGLVHFIALGTEDNPINAYEMSEVDNGNYGDRYKRRFAEHYGSESPQYKWLMDDLKAVDRKKTPWVVLYTHRPIYHTSNHHRMCSKDGDWYGCAVRALYEKLYEQYKVDLVMSGHAHHYQRSRPMQQGKAVAAGEHGVVYIVCGVGGYRLDAPFPPQSTPWVAYRHSNYFGYCKFTPHNLTHLEWVHVAATPKGPKPLDQHWLQRQIT